MVHLSQNGHFGVTSFLWQTPSQDVLDRLQSRALESEQNAGDRKGPGSGRRSMSAISARSAGSPSNPLPAAAKREKDEAGEIWITEVTEAEQNEASELGLLRANASMLGNWESCECMVRLVAVECVVADTAQWPFTG